MCQDYKVTNRNPKHQSINNKSVHVPVHINILTKWNITLHRKCLEDIFLEALRLLFWTSGNVWNAFQNQDRFPWLCADNLHMVDYWGSPLCETPADFLVASTAAKLLTHILVQATVGVKPVPHCVADWCSNWLRYCGLVLLNITSRFT